MKIEVKTLAAFVGVVFVVAGYVTDGDASWFTLGFGTGISLGLIVGDL